MKKGVRVGCFSLILGFFVLIVFSCAAFASQPSDEVIVSNYTSDDGVSVVSLGGSDLSFYKSNIFSGSLDSSAAVLYGYYGFWYGSVDDWTAESIPVNDSDSLTYSFYCPTDGLKMSSNVWQYYYTIVSYGSTDGNTYSFTSDMAVESGDTLIIHFPVDSFCISFGSSDYSASVAYSANSIVDAYVVLYGADSTYDPVAYSLADYVTSNDSDSFDFTVDCEFDVYGVSVVAFYECSDAFDLMDSDLHSYTYSAPVFRYAVSFYSENGSGALGSSGSSSGDDEDETSSGDGDEDETSSGDDDEDETVGWLQKIWSAITGIADSIIDGIVGIFVPDEEFMTDWKSDMSDLLEERLGVLYQSGSILSSFFSSINSSLSDPSETGFEFPGISIPINGETYTIVEAQSISIDNDVFDILQPIIGTFVCILATFAALMGFKAQLMKFLGDNSEDS